MRLRVQLPMLRNIKRGHSVDELTPASSKGSDMRDRLMAILSEAKKLAREYRTLTGKPLGITGEVAEYEAARLLGVELMQARQAGYDAIEQSAGKTRHLQIKGRCLLPGCKPGQRLEGPLTW
jgi:hypothetical protein